MQSSRGRILLFLVSVFCMVFGAAAEAEAAAAAVACSSGECKLGDRCSSEDDCGSELYCYNCWLEFAGRKCVRTTVANPFEIVVRVPDDAQLLLQDDSVTNQLNNGVRALMLDVYDFRDDVWLCHSKGGRCFDFTAFEPAIETLREVEAFLSSNPSEIVTLILEDYVQADRGLSKLFRDAGLVKYWFPVSRMPRHGGDWPRVRDMVARNHRLLVFTSARGKQDTEGIAYQWDYMVENQYGDDGMRSGSCGSRSESAALDDAGRSLVLVNYFHTVPIGATACLEHSRGLTDMLRTCHDAAGGRWANFVAVDYYRRSDGGGVFEATDMLNGMLICGRDDKRTLKDAVQDLLGNLQQIWKWNA